MLCSLATLDGCLDNYQTRLQCSNSPAPRRRKNSTLIYTVIIYSSLHEMCATRAKRAGMPVSTRSLSGAGVVERGFVLVRVGGRCPVGSSTFCVDRQLETHSQQTRSVARQRRPERDLAGIIDPQSQISLNTAVSRRNFFFLRYSFQFCSNHVPPPVGSSSHLCLSLPYL